MKKNRLTIKEEEPTLDSQLRKATQAVSDLQNQLSVFDGDLDHVLDMLSTHPVNISQVEVLLRFIQKAIGKSRRYPSAIAESLDEMERLTVGLQKEIQRLGAENAELITGIEEKVMMGVRSQIEKMTREKEAGMSDAQASWIAQMAATENLSIINKNWILQLGSIPWRFPAVLNAKDRILLAKLFPSIPFTQAENVQLFFLNGDEGNASSAVAIIRDPTVNRLAGRYRAVYLGSIQSRKTPTLVFHRAGVAMDMIGQGTQFLYCHITLAEQLNLADQEGKTEGMTIGFLRDRNHILAESLSRALRFYLQKKRLTSEPDFDTILDRARVTLNDGIIKIRWMWDSRLQVASAPIQADGSLATDLVGS